MALLNDSNLAQYKLLVDSLQRNIHQWPAILSEAERLLSNNTGSTFRTEYAIGRKATTNMQKILDILQSLQNDLDALTNAANDFYLISYNASRR